MFKGFSRKTGPTEEEKLALAIAKSLSLQATAGGDGVATSSSNEGVEGVVVGSPTNTRMLATPKVEIRQDRVYSDDEDDDHSAPPLPEGSMKVGNKTPDGTLITEELKSQWKRCIKEGRITDLEAKEMSYSDLIALLGPSRRVLLSRRQLEEIRDDATITGKIVILHDGFIWYLLHLIKKLRHRIWYDKRHIKELESQITNFAKEVCRLMTQIEGMEKIIHLLQEEVKTLKDENEKLNKAVEYLAGQVKENLAEIQKLNEKIRKLEREAQFWKDKAEEEKKNADKYKRLYHRCSKQLKETQHAFDQRRHEVVDILMKPLPGGCNFAEDEESEEGEKTVD